MQKTKIINVRLLTTAAIAGAISFVLMFLELSLPIAPSFIKLDFSDVPSLILAFAFGPLAGVLTELIKNLLHLFITSTAGIGELSNFLLGCAYVAPAGWIYRFFKTRKGALLGMLVGTLCFSVFGIFSNLFLMFPFYTKVVGFPMAAIIQECQKIIPFVDSQAKVILISVTPFNLFKGVLESLVTFFLYKRISPLLKRDKA